jgi:hypothetical protein
MIIWGDFLGGYLSFQSLNRLKDRKKCNFREFQLNQVTQIL